MDVPASVSSQSPVPVGPATQGTTTVITLLEYNNLLIVCYQDTFSKEGGMTLFCGFVLYIRLWFWYLWWTVVRTLSVL